MVISVKDVRKLTNQDDLIDIALTNNDKYVRNEAVNYIHDEIKLKEIAKTNLHSWVRVNAIWHIEDKLFILNVIENDENRFVRKSAKERLKKLLD